MKYFWLIVLLLIVFGVLWLRRRGTGGGAAPRPSLGERTPAEAVSGTAVVADEGGRPASVFDPVEAPTAVAPAAPVAPAADEPQDYQPRRGAGIDEAADGAAKAAPVTDEAAPADEVGAAAAEQEGAASAEPEVAVEQPTGEPAEEPAAEQLAAEEPGSEEPAAESAAEQPSWTTSQWDPDHTVAEERGEGDHPHFDDDVSEPASADEAAEVHEGAFDADHPGAAEDTVASSEESADTEEAPVPGEAESAAGEAQAPAAADQAEDDAEQPSPSVETDESAHESNGDDALRQRGDWRAGEGEEPQVLTASDASDLGHGAPVSPDADSSDSDGGADKGPWVRRTSSLDEVQDGGYGVGSAATFEDRAMPLGHPVKAWEDTKSYVTPDHTAYDDAEPHLWFHDADAAQAAGFHSVD